MKNIYYLVISLVGFISLKPYAQCQTPSVVPYYEGFQGITSNNQLPACWAVSNTTQCITSPGGPNNGTAGFYAPPVGGSYFYTNGVLLQSGITYSIASRYQANYYGFGNWSWDFSMGVGPNQSVNGLQTIASSVNTGISNSFTPLSNTFTVQFPGVYYFAIKGSASCINCGFFFTWDDFSVTIPCTAAYNSPNIILTVNSTTICYGSPVNLSASGANTYTWNNGATGPSNIDVPVSDTLYFVTGTNTLSGCASTSSISITLKPSPNLIIQALVGFGEPNPVICEGSAPIPLTATGADTYTWNTGLQINAIWVSPTLTTIYTVTGTNVYGCQATSSVLVGVNPKPVVSVNNAGIVPCIGETVSLTANGANSYEWSNSSGLLLVGSFISFVPSVNSLTFYVTGTDTNGCVGKTSFIFNADECTGLDNSTGRERRLKIYPNPCDGKFVLQSDNAESKFVVVTDVLGKTVFSTSCSDEKIQINLSDFSNGIYQAKVLCRGSANFFRLVKND